MFTTYFWGFIICGSICMIAQIIYDNTNWSAGHITSLFVIVGAVLDLFHFYDFLVKVGQAGATLPITSFGHSLMHGAMESVQENGFFGLAMGIFDMTAMGISSAILFAFLAALVFKPKS
jgi:stage V sporulation protein AE